MELPNQVIVTQLNVGEHPSSTAGRAEVIIDVQYLPQERNENKLGGRVKREVEEHIANVSRLDPYLAHHPPRVEWILDADCAEIPESHPLIGAFRDACRDADEPMVVWGLGAHTDMGSPTELGNTPTVNFGPGDPSEAHQPDENVSVADLIKTTKIMALTIANWCA